MHGPPGLPFVTTCICSAAQAVIRVATPPLAVFAVEAHAARSALAGLPHEQVEGLIRQTLVLPDSGTAFALPG
jgi:hypothetical protein